MVREPTGAKVGERSLRGDSGTFSDCQDPTCAQPQSVSPDGNEPRPVVVTLDMNTQKANPERIRARQELRRSGAAGKHQDRRTKRQRTRAARKDAALREWR